MDEFLLFGVFLSLLLGSIVGLQREMRIQKENKIDFAGFRTFSFISLLGFLLTYISFEYLESQLLLLIGFAGILLFDLVAYLRVSQESHNVSVSSQITSLITFLLGVLVGFGLYHLAITLTIILTSMLFFGNKLHDFSKNLSKTEVFASIKFAIISIVILPFLPNQNYSPLEIPFLSKFLFEQSLVSIELLSQLNVINPYKIWLMVVFISSISFAGYILMRTIGAKKGILITGLLGGLVSSTATTMSFSLESKRYPHLYIPLMVGVVLACSIMFFRILFEVMIINYELFPSLFLPMILMGLTGILGAIFIFKRTRLDSVKNVKVNSPFTIIPALKFGFFFLMIGFFSKLFSILYGSGGIYFVSFFSGLADVDAITISLSNMAKNDLITNSTAQIGILIAAFSNTFVKMSIAFWFGSKKFALGVTYLLGLVMAIGLISFFLF